MSMFCLHIEARNGLLVFWIIVSMWVLLQSSISGFFFFLLLVFLIICMYVCVHPCPCVHVNVGALNRLELLNLELHYRFL